MLKIKEHSNRRIVKWFDSVWKGPLKVILSNSLAMGRDIVDLIRLLRATAPT